ncbi:MAG: glycine oxidase ThiO [Gammaproteobacteria bacterium]|nr:glycine oxidase ThiO [Gammaproteobacteria bacterium]
MPDCLIIGGGVIGLMTARELAQAGLKVTLLERGKTGREASWAAGGILSPLYPWHYPEAVNTLALWSQRRYAALARELLDETGIDPEYIRSGLLILDETEQSPAQDWAEHNALLEILCTDSLRTLEPELAPRPDSALLFSEVAQIRNPRLLQALKQSVLQQGVVIEEDAEVGRLLTQMGHINGVETGRGRYQTSRVIIAGGAWSGALLAGLGLGVQVTPMRGQILLMQAPVGWVRHILSSQQRYIIPRRDGRLLIGSTLEQAGFDKSVTEEGLLQLKQFAATLVPSLKNYRIERHWAGLRPGSPKGVPYIGEHPRIKGLYLSTGHFRNGIVMAPGSAHLLADILLNRQPIVDPSPYRPMMQ